MNKKMLLIIIMAAPLALFYTSKMVTNIEPITGITAGDFGSAIAGINSPGGTFSPGVIFVIKGMIRNESKAFIDVNAYSIAYHPNSQDVVTGRSGVSKWEGTEVIPGGYQDSKTLISTSCFVFPFKMSISNGSHLSARSREYGKEIAQDFGECVNQSLIITIKDTDGIGGDVLVQISTVADGKTVLAEYLYDLNGWFKGKK